MKHIALASLSIPLIIIAMVMTAASIAVSILILQANSMSDAPSGPFEGGGMIATVWLITAALWIWVYFS